LVTGDKRDEEGNCNLGWLGTRKGKIWTVVLLCEFLARAMMVRPATLGAGGCAEGQLSTGIHGYVSIQWRRRGDKDATWVGSSPLSLFSYHVWDGML
jgi:hypothetical protein